MLTVNDMESQIIARLNMINKKYIPVIDHRSIANIYNAMFNDVIIDTDDGTTNLYYGYHYQTIGNISEMVKCFTKSSNKGNIDATYSLGVHYEQIGKYNDMKKYYYVATTKGCVEAMIKLGKFYDKQKDYVNAIKYYHKAHEKSDINA